MEKFRAGYVKQHFEHLDLDFENYLDCTNEEITEKEIADFCLKKPKEVEVDEEMDNLIIGNDAETKILLTLFFYNSYYYLKISKYELRDMLLVKFNSDSLFLTPKRYDLTSVLCRPIFREIRHIFDHYRVI